jgi:hypothetical protein
MSYDTYMVIDTGGEYPATVKEIGNMTSNVSPMWSLALQAAGCKPEQEGHRFLLSKLEGWSGADAIPVLEKAVAHIYDAANYETYAALNPENGWGDVDSARRYLRNILEACREHPKAKLHFST